MSLAKRRLEQIEDYYEIAFEAMLDVGAIKTCSMHDSFYYNTYTYDNSTIYGIVTNKLKEIYGEKQDYKLFHQQIDKILSEAGTAENECPTCQKLADD